MSQDKDWRDWRSSDEKSGLGCLRKKQRPECKNSNGKEDESEEGNEDGI
jgi:hypothetical protein